MTSASIEDLKSAHDEARAHASATQASRPTANDSTPNGALTRVRAELAAALAQDAERTAAHHLGVALDAAELQTDTADTIESLDAAAARSEQIRAELARIDSASCAVVHGLAARLAEVARDRAGQGLPGPRVRLAAGSWPVVLEGLRTPLPPPSPDGRLGALRYAEREAVLVCARIEQERVARERERAEVEARNTWNADARNREAMERSHASLAESRAARADDDALVAAYESGGAT